SYSIASCRRALAGVNVTTEFTLSTSLVYEQSALFTGACASHWSIFRACHDFELCSEFPIPAESRNSKPLCHLYTPGGFEAAECQLHPRLLGPTVMDPALSGQAPTRSCDRASRFPARRARARGQLFANQISACRGPLRMTPSASGA